MNRYYKGSPFIEKNIIGIEEIGNSYFKEVYQFNNITSFEYYIDGSIILVIYEGVTWNDDFLINFHKKTYGEIPYHTEEYLSKRCLKTTIVQDYRVEGYNILTYNNDWLVELEQWFDKNYQLIEYRKLFYEEKILIKEFIFDAIRWKIDKEEYT